MRGILDGGYFVFPRNVFSSRLGIHRVDAVLTGRISAGKEKLEIRPPAEADDGDKGTPCPLISPNRNTLNKQMFPSYTSQYYPATVTNDGFYRVMVAEHVGDTRGNDWYTELTCLAADISAPASSAVLPAG
jgi:hypothetical protein